MESFSYAFNTRFEPIIKHELLVYQKEPYGSIADVCSVCSDPDKGIWVPVSFCPEAKADADKYYKQINKDYLELLIERGKRGKG